MNRSRYIPRDFEAEAEFSHSLNDHIAALREFGGEIRIGADRAPVDKDGNLLPRTERGAGFITVGYLIGFTERSRIPNAPEEPDEAFGATEPPEIVVESPNGADQREPEAVEA